MASFDSSRVFSAFDGLVEHMQSIELPPLDTFHVSETLLPAFKALTERFSEQHSCTKKAIASLRSAWTCISSVPPNTPSQAVLESSGSSILLPASSLPVATPDAVTDVASGNSELENSRQLVHQLQQQLQDLTTQYESQNEDVCTQNERQRLQISELEARLLAAPSNSSSSHAVSPKCSAGIVSGKNRRNEQYLRDVFNRHKDAQAGLSGQNLVQALQYVDAPNIPISVQDISDVMNQFDANSNGVLEFGEFQQVANEPDELQLWLGEKQLPIAADALRPLVGRGSDQLKTFSQLSPADVAHAAAATCAFIPSMLKELHQELQAAFAVQSRIEADMKADSSKFNDFFKMACGTITDFHKGLTGRVGMPHLNFKNAMRQEHCERAGCDVQFFTGNYKITTTPRQEWRYIVENVPCPDMGHKRRIIPISELMQLDISKTAKLCEEEVMAIVLYTGPMFQIYNTILRQYPKVKFAAFRDGDNLFSTTIFVLVSAVQKLSRCTRIPLGAQLYRGLGGKVDLPDIFFQTDDKGCSGYAEWGFLSTTSDRDVALGYSGVKERRPKAMVMVIETSSIDRGADISEFSQYPGEKEFLYLPCSFLQRPKRGGSRVEIVDGGLVTLIPVIINLNLKTETTEELKEKKKRLHLANMHGMIEELRYELCEWAKESKAAARMEQDSSNETQRWIYGYSQSNLSEATLKQAIDVLTRHEAAALGEYVDDGKYRALVNEMLDTKLWAIEKMELWMSDSRQRIKDLEKSSLRDCHRLWQAFLRKSIDSFAKGSSDRANASMKLLASAGFTTEVLLERNVDDEYAMVQAGADGWSASIIAAFVSAGADPDVRHDNGRTGLWNAASLGNTESMAALLAANVDVNQCDNEGRSPIYIAALNDHAACVSLLISAGGDINRCDNEGMFPVYVATMNNCIDILGLLINGGGDVNYSIAKMKYMFKHVHEWGRNFPISIASERGFANCIKLIASAGGDVHKCRYDGFSPIQIASCEGFPECITQLLLSRADVNECGRMGHIPEYLEVYEVKIQISDNGRSPIYLALEYSRTECLDLLMSAKGDVTKCDNDGKSPIYVAARMGRNDYITKLLSAGGDVNKCDNDGKSPFDVAAENGYTDCLKLLLGAGAKWPVAAVVSTAAEPDSAGRLVRSSQELVNLLMARLAHNELGLADAFHTFDSSGVGVVTHQDLSSVCTSIQLDIIHLDMSEQEVDVLYGAFGVSLDDGIRIEQWTRTLSEAILQSLGIEEGGDALSDLPQAAAAASSSAAVVDVVSVAAAATVVLESAARPVRSSKELLNLLMETLAYNEISPADAFEAFKSVDSSGSGAVTRGIFRTSIQLDMSELEVDVLFGAFGVSLDDGIRIEQWTRTLC